MASPRKRFGQAAALACALLIVASVASTAVAGARPVKLRIYNLSGADVVVKTRTLSIASQDEWRELPEGRLTNRQFVDLDRVPEGASLMAVKTGATGTRQPEQWGPFVVEFDPSLPVQEILLRPGGMVLRSKARR